MEVNVQHASTSRVGDNRSRFRSTMLPEENSTRINDKEKHTRLDWQSFRTQSLQPGGFGEGRVTIWYVTVIAE